MAISLYCFRDYDTHSYLFPDFSGKMASAFLV